MLTRKTLLSLPLVACTAALAARPDLIRDFDPARQAALYPADRSFLALYRRGGQTLGWVAAKHSADPNGQTAQTLRMAFARVRPRAVILEGVPSAWGVNPRRLIDQLSRLAPGEGNEGDLAARLVLNSGAAIWGGEPTESDLGAALIAQGFSAEDVIHSALFGPLEQQQREGAFSSPADPLFPAAFAAMAADIARGYGLGSAPSLDQFRAWHQRTFGAPLSEATTWYERGWPNGDTVPARIARASNRQRDIQAYRVTLERLTADRMVLVVYGASHLSNVWDALAAVLGPPELVGV